MMPNRDYEAFLKGDLELPISECELRQRGVADPQIYRGLGLISQDKHDGLVLRIFVTEHSDDAMMRHMQVTFSSKPGELISDEHYYDFQCLDQSGHLWKASALDPSLSFAKAVSGTAKIRYLTYTADLKPKRRISIVRAEARGDFEIPWHEVTKSGARTDVDVFASDGIDYSWKVRKAPWGMTIEEFKVHDGSAAPHFRRFLIALGIACGKSVVSVLTQTVDSSGEHTIELHSPRRPRWNAKILRPVPHRRHEAHATHEFIRAFLRGVETQGEDRTDFIYSLWHRVLRAREHDVANSSLVLTVAIESLLDRCFRGPLDVDAEFLEEISHAKELLDGVGLRERARKRILASLDSAGRARPIDVLWRLQEQGFIGKVHIDAWKKLRNAVAHGEDVDAHENLQKNLDLFHQCVGLFHRLIFILITYRGDYVDYSSSGWPTRRFSPAPPASAAA